jgi:hypothetical protein
VKQEPDAGTSAYGEMSDWNRGTADSDFESEAIDEGIESIASGVYY